MDRTAISPSLPPLATIVRSIEGHCGCATTAQGVVDVGSQSFADSCPIHGAVAQEWRAYLQNGIYQEGEWTTFKSSENQHRGAGQ